MLAIYKKNSANIPQYIENISDLLTVKCLNFIAGVFSKNHVHDGPMKL